MDMKKIFLKFFIKKPKKKFPIKIYEIPPFLLFLLWGFLFYSILIKGGVNYNKPKNVTIN
jgi:hypothetical protein